MSHGDDMTQTLVYRVKNVNNDNDWWAHTPQLFSVHCVLTRLLHATEFFLRIFIRIFCEVFDACEFGGFLH